MKKYILGSLFAIALIIGARLSLYTVDAAEYAYVTVLGHHYDVACCPGAGLVRPDQRRACTLVHVTGRSKLVGKSKN